MTITHKTYRKLTILFITALVVLFAVATVGRIRQLERNLDVLNNFQLSQAVVLAVEGLATPATVEPQTTKQYLPGAKLVLPPLHKNVGYVSYSGVLDKEYMGVNISSDRNVSAAKSKFLFHENQGSVEKTLAGVPHLQACARGVLVTLQDSPANVGSKPEGSKTLKNGQKVYFYSEPLCKNEELLAYVKNIESY